MTLIIDISINDLKYICDHLYNVKTYLFEDDNLKRTDLFEEKYFLINNIYFL